MTNFFGKLSKIFQFTGSDTSEHVLFFVNFELSSHGGRKIYEIPGIEIEKSCFPWMEKDPDLVLYLWNRVYFYHFSWQFGLGHSVHRFCKSADIIHLPCTTSVPAKQGWFHLFQLAFDNPILNLSPYTALPAPVSIFRPPENVFITHSKRQLTSFSDTTHNPGQEPA